MMKKYITLILTVLIVGLSIFLMSRVVVNYNMKKYLPDDDPLKEGILLHDELYGESSYTNLLLKDVSLSDALEVKNDKRERAKIN